MKSECILERPKSKQEMEVREKQLLINLLTQEQITDFQSGKLVAISGGNKLKLDEEIKGMVMMLTPLQGG